MKHSIFIKDSPIDEKRIGLIEKVITRLSRRSQKKTTSITSPQPISVVVTGEDVKGDILKCMLFKGYLGKCIVAFNKKPKSSVCIEVKVLNSDGGFNKSFYVSTITKSFKLDLDTEDGAMVVISIHSVSEDYQIKEVWLSMLWTPHISHTKSEQFLLDSILNGEEDERV